MDVLTYVKRNANLSTLTLGVGTVLAGTGAAALRGNMEILAATVCLFFVIFAQMAVNFAHNYNATAKYYDNLPRPRYSVTAEEPVRDRLAVRVLREASFACCIIAGMLGLAIMTFATSPWWVFATAAIIIIINWLLNFGRHPLFGHPVTIVFTWLLFGPVGVISTSFLQCQHEAVSMWGSFDNLPSLFLGPAMGFMACNVHLMYGYSMYRFDPRRNARGIAYQWGPRVVEWMFAINGLLMLALLFFGVFYMNIPRPGIVVIPAFIAFALNSYVAIRMHFVPIGEIKNLNMMVKVNYLLLGLLIFIIWWVIGTPDDSMMTIF